MRWCLGTLLLLATAAAAQQPTPPPPADSASVDTALPSPSPSPPLPTPEQEHYLRGLRTASRGVAQLRDGVDRVVRSQSGRDTLARRRAARRLGGLCSAATSFISNGRAQMGPTAYEDSARVHARALTARIDSLLRYLPTCEGGASRTPDQVAGEVEERLHAFDTALRSFRAAIGLPNRP